MTTTREYTINQIQAEMRADGSHWWDPDSMRFFGTRVLNSTVFKGDGGIFFVTSEWDGFSGRENNKRAYTIRKYIPETKDIETVGDIGQYRSADAANAEIERLCASNGVAIREQHEPISDAAQLLHDLRKHGNPETHKSVAASLIQHATRHHKMMEDYCNGKEIYNADGEPRRPLANLRGLIEANAKAAGCKGVLFSGDPRGCTVKLVMPDGYTDDFAKEGLCVPTTSNE